MQDPTRSRLDQVRTISVAAAFLLLLAGTCFAVQAAALGRPGFAKLELLRSLHSLGADSGAPPHAMCRGAAIEVDACRRAVTGLFSEELEQGARVVASRVEVAGRPDYALRIPTATPKLELLVTRAGATPVGLALGVPHAGEAVR